MCGACAGAAQTCARPPAARLPRMQKGCRMKEKLWRAAFAQTLPVLAGYLFLGFAYGVLMRRAGFSTLWAVGLSLFIYAGSMQYAAVPVLTGAFDPIGAFLLSIMVNARHMFYGISMLEKYRRAGKWAPYLIFSLTDETFSVNVAAKVPQGVDETAFYAATSALDHAYWVGATLLGAVLGGVLTLEVKGIEFVMTALFVTIFTDQWLAAKRHGPALLGLGGAAVCLAVFGAANFMLPAMALITGALLIWRSVAGGAKGRRHDGGAMPHYGCGHSAGHFGHALCALCAAAEKTGPCPGWWNIWAARCPTPPWAFWWCTA